MSNYHKIRVAPWHIAVGSPMVYWGNQHPEFSPVKPPSWWSERRVIWREFTSRLRSRNWKGIIELIAGHMGSSPIQPSTIQGGK